MRRTCRLLAAVKPARYLESGTPTGLTGLFTHHAPRSTLMYLYSSTLDKLKEFPESSLYRTSTEAITKHRMQIVEATIPPGYEAWKAKAEKIIAENPEVFNTPAGGVDHDGGRHLKQMANGRVFVHTKIDKPYDEYSTEWDGEKAPTVLEGTRTTEERKYQSSLAAERPGDDSKTITWESEPALTAQQIEEVENKIGAGLIEEVIQVAEGELKLVDVMLKSKAWEDLEDKPVEGQWTYFTRDTATPPSQAPPQK
ncbi:NADH-ubiquinone oxidoreductase subunit 2 [Coleophoma crateriformis]|uniref:NADH-ubiquinone oxidoreductase subunit 2 n=1 Tax=Coleophoma crateriformis TaxID=565419 RepID=A0A3D8T0G5_9HELO|nr:NADH-ubiquinone oxidoreductase subunit 2 [Coleophoma crateriformis]